MINNPLFSVLIAQYNNGKYLQEAIDSVKAQTYTNWEIILVDDASTDNSRELYELFKDDKRIKIYYNEENKGCGYTKRRCVKLAEGEFCGFLDPDDALKKDAVSCMVYSHIEFIDASLVYSSYIRCDDNLNEKYVNQNQCQIPQGTDYLHYNRGAVHHFACFKRSKYLQTTGIDPTFKRAIDQDLYYKLEEVGSLMFMDRPLYLYRFHEGGISLNENIYKALYWHIKAIQNACIRRGIEGETENIVNDLINCIVKPKDFKIKVLNEKLLQYSKPNIKIVLKCIYKWMVR